MDEKLKHKQQLREEAAESNLNCDYEYHALLNKVDRLNDDMALPFDVSTNKIQISIRKRPLLPKEHETGEQDILSTCNPNIRVHEPKLKVDGITKHIENHDFRADSVFGSNCTSEEVYRGTIQPGLRNLVK